MNECSQWSRLLDEESVSQPAGCVDLHSGSRLHSFIPSFIASFQSVRHFATLPSIYGHQQPYWSPDLLKTIPLHRYQVPLDPTTKSAAIILRDDNKRSRLEYVSIHFINNIIVVIILFGVNKASLYYMRIVPQAALLFFRVTPPPPLQPFSSTTT